MNRSRERAAYETQLAVAHRALYRAFERADEMGDEGAADDLHGLMEEVHRLTEASLKGKLRVRP